MASWKAFAGLLIGAAFAAGCGGSGDPEPTDAAGSNAAPAAPTAAADAAPPQMAGGPPGGGHGGAPMGQPAEMQTAAAPGAQMGGHGGPPDGAPSGGPPGYPGGPPPGYGPPGADGPPGSGAPQMAHGQGPPGGYPGYPGGPPGTRGSTPANPSTAPSSNPLQNLFGGIDNTLKGEPPSETPIAGMPGAPGTYPGGYPGAAMPGGPGAGSSGPPGGHGAAGAGPPGYPGLPGNPGTAGGHGAAGGAPSGHGAGAPGGAAGPPAGYPGGPEGYPGGPEGYPGGPEGTESAPGQGQVPSYDEGTPEYAVQKLVIQVAKGDLSGLDEVISARATGVLAQLREGEVPEDRLEKLKTQMARVKLLNRRSDGGTYNVFLQNDQSEVLHFTCRREGEDYLVKEFNVREAPRRRAKR